MNISLGGGAVPSRIFSVSSDFGSSYDGAKSRPSRLSSILFVSEGYHGEGSGHSSNTFKTFGVCSKNDLFGRLEEVVWRSPLLNSFKMSDTFKTFGVCFTNDWFGGITGLPLLNSSRISLS